MYSKSRSSKPPPDLFRADFAVFARRRLTVFFGFGFGLDVRALLAIRLRRCSG